MNAEYYPREGMSEADWRTVGYIGVTLGVLLLMGGSFTYYFSQDYYMLGYKIATVYPYRDYSVGLFVAGVALAVVGAGAWWRSDVEKQTNVQTAKPAVSYPHQFAQSVPRKFCRFCGTENKSDAVFCEKCGRQIDEPKSPSQPTRRCANCGEELDPKDSWCRKCGKVVPS